MISSGINVGKGHARSVDCVAVDPTKQYIATGSFDTNLKIWSANLTNVDEGEPDNGDGESGSKKAKSTSKAPTRTPLMTIAGTCTFLCVFKGYFWVITY